MGFRWAAVGCVLAACETVDLGDNFVPPDVQTDDDFFFCQIQPSVIARHSCASGPAGNQGQCHAGPAFPPLSALGETDEPPECEENRVVGTVPVSYEENLESIRTALTSDPFTSPFYRRPTGLDAHPLTLFDEDSVEAELIVEWISGGDT